MNFNQLYLKLFTKQKVGRQLMSLFFFTILIPVLIAGSIVYQISYRQIKENYEHLSESEAIQIRSVLVTTTLYLHDMYESIAGDETLRELLSKDYKDAKEAQIALTSYNGFQEVLENTASLTSLKLYVDEEILKQDKSYSYFQPITEDIRTEDWYKKAKDTKGNFWMSNTRLGQANVNYWELNYYCHVPIPATGSSAILVMTISNDYLRNLISDDDYDVYVSVNQDPVFFSSDRDYAGEEFPVTVETKNGYYNETKIYNLFRQNMIGSIQTFRPYATSDNIYILAADPNALPNLRHVQLVFLWVMLFALLISALLIYLFAGYFSARIQTLRLAMHKVSNNDYEIVNSIHGDDELSATFSDLKSMVHKLKETEAAIYETQIREQALSNQQQQMELKLLANQINPHFLYNTLETIRMKAFSEGNREVANAIKLLGKSMRYVLNNTKTSATTLDKEMDYIKTYLSIQKLRFGQRLLYSIKGEDTLNLSNYQILPLLVQPIVENSLSHGLERTDREVFVEIALEKTENDLLRVTVSDNGVGMNEETLKEVIAHLSIPQNESDHGVGLYNINNRVHLFYGTQYGLTIESLPNEKTTVTLTIPLYNLTEDET